MILKLCLPRCRNARSIKRADRMRKWIGAGEPTHSTYAAESSWFAPRKPEMR